ncbi:PaeR7I family type II restriction endonuclease [Plantactinospora sp. WMMB334]|uniref:PaeR7I family type II restriction endonuclease n=1 Tax=Plantactinospora sp. WMMB334 TaxID=3404119 RepID=UPI003B95B9D8
MPVTRQDFEDAVAAYWGAKRSQSELSRIKDKVGAGTAGSVRGGKHFQEIAALIAKFFLEAGYPPYDIRVTPNQRLELPGYYRPQKQWDLVVAHRNTLIAAFELKALGDPSFGNNYNNRVEEALGSALDLRRAALAELFPGEKPWLGYFFVMEDAPGSRDPVRTARGAFPVDPIWTGRSYQERFSLFCQRLLDERIYDAVCYITSSADDSHAHRTGGGT